METYVLLVLDIAYSYTALMLLFGAAHLCSLLCGAGTAGKPQSSYMRSVLVCGSMS